MAEDTFRAICSYVASWSGVQFGIDEVAAGLSDLAHAAALAQVLTDLAVEVLDAAALPRSSSGVAAYGGAVLRSVVVMELCAVIEGEGAEPVAATTSPIRRQAGNSMTAATSSGGRIPTLPRPSGETNSPSPSTQCRHSSKPVSFIARLRAPLPGILCLPARTTPMGS